MFEKLRIHMTRLFAAISSGIIFFSSSAWETQIPFLSFLFLLIGILLVAIATLGRLCCTFYIGGYKTEKLITGGPCSMSGHPLYFFSFIGGIGVGFIPFGIEQIVAGHYIGRDEK